MPKFMNLATVAGAVEGTGFDLTTIMQGAIDQVKGDVLGVLAIVVPALVLIVGAVVGVRFGMKWLKKMGS